MIFLKIFNGLFGIDKDDLGAKRLEIPLQLAELHNQRFGIVAGMDTDGLAAKIDIQQDDDLAGIVVDNAQGADHAGLLSHHLPQAFIRTEAQTGTADGAGDAAQVGILLCLQHEDIKIALVADRKKKIFADAVGLEGQAHFIAVGGLFDWRMLIQLIGDLQLLEAAENGLGLVDLRFHSFPPQAMMAIKAMVAHIKALSMKIPATDAMQASR